MEKIMLTVEEVAKQLGLSRSKTYAMVAGGELPCVRVGRRRLIPRELLNEWVREKAEESRIVGKA